MRTDSPDPGLMLGRIQARTARLGRWLAGQPPVEGRLDGETFAFRKRPVIGKDQPLRRQAQGACDQQARIQRRCRFRTEARRQPLRRGTPRRSQRGGQTDHESSAASSPA